MFLGSEKPDARSVRLLFANFHAVSFTRLMRWTKASALACEHLSFPVEGPGLESPGPSTNSPLTLMSGLVARRAWYA